MGMSFLKWTYRFAVRHTDLLTAFQHVRDRFRSMFVDLQHYGVVQNLDNAGLVNRQLLITANSPADMQVNCQPGVAITQDGQRIYRPTGSVDKIDCSVDKNGDPTIPGAGNKRYISIYIVAKYDENDTGQPSPVDGYGDTYKLNQIVGHTFEVEAGAEVALAGSGVIPTGRTDAVLLATILLYEGTTTIVNATDPYLSSGVAGEISYVFRQGGDKYNAHYGKIFSARDHLDVRKNLGEGSNPAGSKIYAENLPRAWANITGGTGNAATKYNIASAVRDNVGRYTITVPSGYFASQSSVIPQVTVADSIGSLVPQIGRAWATDANTIKVEIIEDTGGGFAYTDLNFFLVVFGRVADAQLSPLH